MNDREKLAAEAFNRLPKFVRVAAFDFEIAGMSQSEGSGERKFGSCSLVELKIKLQSVMPAPEKLVDTFIHEVLHAIEWAYSVEGQEDTERRVGAMSTAFTTLFRDNNWLSPWIMETLHPAAAEVFPPVTITPWKPQ